MVFVEKSTFFHMFLLSKKGQKETFFDILDRKECHLDLKSEVLTKSKNIDILERVSPWLLDRKECHLDLKSEVLTNSKKIDILQRV